MARKKYEVPHGEGSFTYRPSKGLWVGVIEAGWTERGTRRRIEVSSRDKDKAWDKLTALRKQVSEEGSAVVAVASPTIKAWSEEWLEMIRQHDAPQGWAQRRSRINHWVVPELGRRKLESLTPGDVRTVHKAMLDADRSATTILNVHSTLMQMLRAALTEGHRVPTPVLSMRPPEKGVSDRDAIPLADALKLTAHIATLPDASRWVAALLQGMRQSECLGLTWDAIDWDNDTIDVSWQVVQLKYADRRAKTFYYPPGREFRQLFGTRHLSRPKSIAGRRVVPMVSWMRQALLQWLEIAPDPSGLVWPQMAAPQRPRGADADREAWHALQAAVGVWKVPPTGPDAEDGVPWTLHEARHTAASLLLLAGVDVEVVRQIMGHSSVAMSRHYQHASAAQKRAALQAVADVLQLPGTSEARLTGG